MTTVTTIFLVSITSLKLSTTFTIKTDAELLTKEFIIESAKDALIDEFKISGAEIEKNYGYVENTVTGEIIEL